MRKVDRFFRGMAMFCLGIVVGFLIAPIKKGINVSIGNNNCDSQLMNAFDGDYFVDDDDFEEDEDYDGPFEAMEDSVDENTVDDEEEIPF